MFGNVTNADGKVVRSLFGKWNEALYCGVAPSARCIWRPGNITRLIFLIIFFFNHKKSNELSLN